MPALGDGEISKWNVYRDGNAFKFRMDRSCYRHLLIDQFHFVRTESKMGGIQVTGGETSAKSIVVILRNFLHFLSHHINFPALGECVHGYASLRFHIKYHGIRFHFRIGLGHFWTADHGTRSIPEKSRYK